MLHYLRHSLDARRPLGTDGEPVTGVLDVAPREDFTTVCFEGGANPKWLINVC